ncbi:hypothetical protein ONJ17_26905, partial [Salmonella enterica subsp. enterica serovar Agona]|nr:hypothetical protein [Salmonella enterica subsp. enterica serovar Agona]
MAESQPLSVAPEGAEYLRAVLRAPCLEGARRMREAGGYVLFDVNLRSKMWGNTDEIPELIARSAAL